jgi:hypothetical protein
MKAPENVFVRLSAAWSLCILLAMSYSIHAQRLSRDLNVDLLINQVGYVPGAGKWCVASGTLNGNFEVIDVQTQKVVYRGSFKPGTDDLGEYSVGEFSALTREGRYYLRADTLRSYPFSVSPSVYADPMNLIVHYFSAQRCGPSTTGYLSPCHLDDGVRIDNGKHQDVSGGWHDASDLRKWVGATIYGVIGLARTFELKNEKDDSRKKILDELLWGNQYFLKMQEPQGYVMSFVGGDVRKHSDSNRWTDNQVAEKGGDLAMVKPTTGHSSQDMLVFGTKDDRVIETQPLDITGQFNFITAQALMARVTKGSDAAYSQKCLQAARKCFEWCVKTNKESNPRIIGASIQAALEMYKDTKQDAYKQFAITQASELEKLQSKSDDEGVGGFFYSSISGREPDKDIWNGCLHLIALCDLIQTFPTHPQASAWKKVVANYSREYLMAISQKNSFGIVPFGLFSNEDPGGNRKVGQYWYRYFMQPEESWWVGVNSNLASAGIGLLKAGVALDDPRLKAAAQRQLDWIMGVNPFNSSTIEGVGYNQPKHFPGSSFSPLTPVLPGAVLNGLGGDHEDQAVIGDGSWQISEYWTPMVAHTIWLMAELSKANN